MTTFAAMSYIVVVNPLVLSATGMDRQDLLVATVLSAVVGTLLMALWANLPLALAPGMGSNIVFAQVVVLQMGVGWRTALTMVFVNAVVFLTLSLTRWREKIVAAFPDSVKLGMQCSIGIFIAFLGLKAGGLVVSNNTSFVAFAKLSDHGALLTFCGLILTATLVVRRIPGAFLLSILFLTVCGLFVRDSFGRPITQMPPALVAIPRLHSTLFLAFDFHEFYAKFFLLLPVTIYFLVSEFFSATATLIGVSRRAGLSTPQDAIPHSKAAFASDAFASVFGAAVGTSTVTAYVESVAGVEAGGRTGLSAVVVALLLASTLLFGPLLAVVPRQATAPTLVLVGIMMMEDICELDRTKPAETLPPLLMLIVTVCTADLMAGLACGCFAYTGIALVLKRRNKLSPVLLILDVIFIGYLILRNAVV